MKAFIELGLGAENVTLQWNEIKASVVEISSHLHQLPLRGLAPEDKTQIKALINFVNPSAELTGALPPPVANPMVDSHGQINATALKNYFDVILTTESQWDKLMELRDRLGSSTKSSLLVASTTNVFNPTIEKNGVVKDHTQITAQGTIVPEANCRRPEKTHGDEALARRLQEVEREEEDEKVRQAAISSPPHNVSAHAPEVPSTPPPRSLGSRTTEETPSCIVPPSADAEETPFSIVHPSTTDAAETSSRTTPDSKRLRLLEPTSWVNALPSLPRWAARTSPHP